MSLVRGCRGCSRSGCFAGLQTRLFSGPWCAIWCATLESLSLLAACKALASDLNPSRPKRRLRRAGESSGLCSEGYWRGQWQQSARGSRAAVRPQGDVWRHDSEAHGCSTTSGGPQLHKQQANCQSPGHHSEQGDFLSSSTNLSAASVLIAIDTSARANCTSR